MEIPTPHSARAWLHLDLADGLCTFPRPPHLLWPYVPASPWLQELCAYTASSSSSLVLLHHLHRSIAREVSGSKRRIVHQDQKRTSQPHGPSIFHHLRNLAKSTPFHLLLAPSPPTHQRRSHATITSPRDRPSDDETPHAPPLPHPPHLRPTPPKRQRQPPRLRPDLRPPDPSPATMRHVRLRRDPADMVLLLQSGVDG